MLHFLQCTVDRRNKKTHADRWRRMSHRAVFWIPMETFNEKQNKQTNSQDCWTGIHCLNFLIYVILSFMFSWRSELLWENELFSVVNLVTISLLQSMVQAINFLFINNRKNENWPIFNWFFTLRLFY